MLSVVTDNGSAQSGSLIDEIVREGARRMLAAVLEVEAASAALKHVNRRHGLDRTLLQICA